MGARPEPGLDDGGVAVMSVDEAEAEAAGVVASVTVAVATVTDDEGGVKVPLGASEGGYVVKVTVLA